MRSLGRPGNANNEFALECENSGGTRLTSNCAYLVRYNRSPEGLHIALRAREASLTMTAAETRTRPALRFSLLGFACFPAVHVPAAIGSVVARGATRTTAVEDITGSIAAEAPDGYRPASWRDSANSMLRHVVSVLAFARGAPLPIPDCGVLRGEQCRSHLLRNGYGGFPDDAAAAASGPSAHRLHCRDQHRKRRHLSGRFRDGDRLAVGTDRHRRNPIPVGNDRTRKRGLAVIADLADLHPHGLAVQEVRQARSRPSR